MFRKSLYLAGALAGALMLSAAAQAAPGETTGTLSMPSPVTLDQIVTHGPAGAVIDVNHFGRRHGAFKRYYRYDDDPYLYGYDTTFPLYFGFRGHHGFHGGFGGGFGHHGGGWGHGGGHGGGHGWGGGHGGGHGGGGGRH